MEIIIFFCSFCGFEQECTEDILPVVPCPECGSRRIESDDARYKIRKGKDIRKGRNLEDDE